MTLEDLGYKPDLEKYRIENDLSAFNVARVIAEHKERYVVKTAENEYDAEIVGSLRYSSQNRSDFPAVGDWVAISEYDDEKALIHSVFPRKSTIERQSVGKKAEKQIIASNIDYAFIVQAVDRDYSINRIERYLTICNASKVKAIIVLNKIDLIEPDELSSKIGEIQKRIKNVALYAISNKTKEGIEKLKGVIHKGKTYCFLGSSGVGKSSILNTIAGQGFMATDTISEQTNRGRHITTHRELRIIDNGGILIDNPGIREVGIADASEGIEVTFDTILALSKKCKFSDCSHTTEKGCAVLSAVESGEIDKNSYENYVKLEKEKDHFESTIASRRKKEKIFGKILKNYKKSNFKK